jgi:hypothetical protein
LPTQTGSQDIDALVKEEKRLVATDCQEEAWADARLQGIEAEIIAEAAIETAFVELVNELGEEVALKLLDTIRERVIAGTYDKTMICH